jgi:hypothetical protein
MSFVDGVQYDRNQTFESAVFGELQPEQIVAWMKNKVYGTATPGPNDRCDRGRSSSLEFYKKALSHYMEILDNLLG